MVFGPLIGGAFGAAAGIGIGHAIFSQDRPRSFKFLTAAADADENIRTPAVASIDASMRALLPLTPSWTSQPDYDRWVMVTRVLRLMWPKLTAAILKEVVKVAKPIMQAELGKIPALKGVLQDVTLGGHSLLDAEHHDAFWEACSKELHLGDHPVRVSGMKVYETTEDTCILETPLIWGSNMALDLSVYLKIGPVTIVVPVRVSDVQFKVLARVTLTPLVDTIPCIGGVTISLLEVPHVDLKLRLFNGPDVMSFPGVKAVVQGVISYVVTQVALYPNSVSVPLMANYGIPEAPKGMVHVRLNRAENIRRTDMVKRSDPYAHFEVRQGRGQRSRTVNNSSNPVWDQEMFLAVDDLVGQSLKIRLFDSDFGPRDDLIGESELFFTEETITTDPATGAKKVSYVPASWVANPGRERKLVVPLRPGGGLFTGFASMVNTTNTTVLKVAKALDDAQSKAIAKAVDQAAFLAEKTAKKKDDQAALAAMEAAEVVRSKQQAKADAYREARAELEAEAAENNGGEDEGAESAGVDAQKQAIKLRGNGVMDPVDPRECAGYVHMTVTFLPFVRPQYDDDIETTPAKEGLAALIPFPPPPAREIVTTVSDFQKGILTVTVIGGKRLSSQAALLSNSIDPYCEVFLVDCDAARPDEKQVTRTCWNDDSPRWNSKLDFTCVSAGSVLNVTVYNKTTLVDMVLSTNLSLERFRDKPVGRVQIPIRDVVRNGVLKDTWALQEAESGTVEMRIEWQNAYMDRDLGG